MRPRLTAKHVSKRANADSLSGTHSMNGMFGAVGRGVLSGKKIDANIIDIAPTILASMGLPVTENMDGQVLSQIFEQAPQISREPASRDKASVQHEYSQEEQEEIVSKLAALGYLE